MADKEINELPTVSTVNDNIQFPVSQNNTAMKLLISDLKANFANYVSSDIDDKVSDAIDDWFAEHGDFGGKLCVISASSTPYTSSMTYSELYQTLVTDHQSVVFLFLDSGSTEYVSSLAYIDPDRVRVVFIMPKTDGTYPVIYVNITSANVITISVDTIGSGSGGSDNTVVLTVDENNNVFNGTTAIKGSQINALAESGKAVFALSGNSHYLFTYSVSLGNGGATFVAPRGDGNGCEYLSVSANSNATTTSTNLNLPYVTQYDNGKVLGVANGNWDAIEPTALPLLVTYHTDTQVFNSSYSEISAAWIVGRIVLCDIYCGNSIFRATLKRFRDDGHDTPYYSFEYSVYQEDDNALWVGRLTVNENNVVHYGEHSFT